MVSHPRLYGQGYLKVNLDSVFGKLNSPER